VRVKAVPKLDVMVCVCEMARANEGVTVVLKHLVVLKHVFFAIHSHSARIFDKIV
jgi:hypothetical protein